MKRLIPIILLLAGCGGQTSAVLISDAPAENYPTENVSTPGTLTIGQVFENHIQNSSAEVGRVGIVWGADKAGSVSRGAYFAYGIYSIQNDTPQSLLDFYAEHPDWIEYQCDKITPAGIPGSSKYGVPMDVTNPDVQQFIFDNAWEPRLAEGYDIDLDDDTAANITGACGHYDSAGTWIQQYTGAEFDAAYTHEAIQVTHAFTSRVHAFDASRKLIIDLQPLPQDLADTITLAEQADIAMDETGVTQFGYITEANWQAENTYALTLSAAGKCFWMIDDEGPDTAPRNPTSTERTWDVANYLLTQGPCSTITITTAQGYGWLLDYPEATVDYGTPIDTATQQSDGSWIRHYTNVTVTVGPDLYQATITETP
jgi:hypothetical protein